MEQLLSMPPRGPFRSLRLTDTALNAPAESREGERQAPLHEAADFWGDVEAVTAHVDGHGMLPKKEDR